MQLQAGGLEVGEPHLIELGDPEWWLRVWPPGHRWEEGDRKDVDIILSFGRVAGAPGWASEWEGLFWPGMDVVAHNSMIVANAEITELPIDINDDAVISEILNEVPASAGFILEQLREHYNLTRRKRRWRIVRSGPTGLLHASIHTREADARNETRHLLREVLQQARQWAISEGRQDLVRKIKAIQKSLSDDKVWSAYNQWLSLLEANTELAGKTGVLTVNET